jgi:hypothetical protein
MNKSSQILLVSPDTFAICKMPSNTESSNWRFPDSFYSITHTSEELSLVCLQSQVPEGVHYKGGWRSLKLEGPFDLSSVGVLNSVIEVLAGVGISIFAISTYNTDYVFVMEADLAKTIQVLTQAGHTVR